MNFFFFFLQVDTHRSVSHVDTQTHSERCGVCFLEQTTVTVQTPAFGEQDGCID